MKHMQIFYQNFVSLRVFPKKYNAFRNQIEKQKSSKPRIEIHARCSVKKTKHNV